MGSFVGKAHHAPKISMTRGNGPNSLVSSVIFIHSLLVLQVSNQSNSCFQGLVVRCWQKCSICIWLWFHPAIQYYVKISVLSTKAARIHFIFHNFWNLQSIMFHKFMQGGLLLPLASRRQQIQLHSGQLNPGLQDENSDFQCTFEQIFILD